MFYLCFPLRVLQFLVLHVGLKSILSLSLYGVRKCSHFILLHVAVQCSQHCLLMRLSLLHPIFLPFFVKNNVPIGAWVYFWAFYLVPLVYISVLCTLLMIVALLYNLKSGSLTPSAPFFLRLLWLFGSFVFPYKL